MELNLTKEHGLRVVLACGLTLLTSQASLAAPGTLANEPLFVSASAQPNIMFLIDNSGSMTNIVPDSPYDSSVTYFTCPDSKMIDPGSIDWVDIRITSSGIPYFRVIQSGSDPDYDWGISGSTGATGQTIKCFDSTANYMARLYADSGSNPQYPSGYLPAQYSGNFLNWYFGSLPTNWGTGARRKPDVLQRMEIAKTAATNLTGSLNNVRVGLTTYNGSNGADILQLMGDISTTRTAVNSSINGLTPSGSTPLAESLRDIGEYFTQGYTGSLTLHPGQSTANGDAFNESTVTKSTLFDRNYTFTPPSTPPIQYSCQKNFTLLLTDGRPQSDQSISNPLRDYDGDCINASPSCLSYDRKPGRDYEDAGSDYLDDVALALYDIDLRPDLNDADGNPLKNNLITYTIGFADDQVIYDPLMQDTATNGGGLFLTANNAGQLAAAFESAASDIMAQIGSSSAVSFNTTTLTTGSAIYTAQFNTTRWSGRLRAFPISSNGAIGSPLWDAATVLDSTSPSNRTILTSNGTDGTPFQWTDLTTDQQNDLMTNSDGSTSTDASIGQARLGYLRGVRTDEGQGNNFRIRSSVLGDIIYSTPIFVGAPDLSWPDSSDFGGTDSYSSFKNGTAKNRQKVIYVGANDGMLHGFNADTGAEVLAYIPNNLFSTASNAGLHYLTDPNYSHRYYVDLTPSVSDVFIKTTSNGSPAWKTVLIGGQRGGGRGLFALDVTDPSTFSENSGAPADIVMWEFNSSHDADLGFTFSKPMIALMENGQWAAIFGNGYNDSGTGQAQLFILFLEEGLDGTWSGSDYIKITTGIGDSSDRNGLSTPALADMNGDGRVDRVYAGDLFGNLWAFNLAGSNTSQWGVAHSQGNTPKPLFTALGSGNTAQPITVAPVLIKNSAVADSNNNQPNVLVLFGTGQYLVDADKTSTAQQTFYAVWDDGTGELTRNNLVAQTLLSGAPAHVRVPTDTAVNYEGSGSTQSGWYFDLPDSGERVIVDAKIRGNLVFFNTMVPSSAPCSLGGYGWLMSMKLINGGPPDEPAFDLDRNGSIDSSDTVTINSTSHAPGGEKFNQGLPSESGLLSNYQFTQDSSGNINVRKIIGGGGQNTGRLSWREIRR